MLMVRFNDADEWLEEVRRMYAGGLKADVAGRVARVTCSRRRHGAMPIVAVQVIASVYGPVDKGERGLCRLEQFTGDFMNGEHGPKALKDAQEIMDRLTKELTGLGFAVSSGVMEYAKDATAL